MKEEKLKLYHEYLERLQAKFKKITFFYLPHVENQFANALATLASMIDIPVGVTMRPLIIEKREKLSYCCTIAYIDGDGDGELPWYLDIWNFISEQKYLEGAIKKDKRAVRRLSAQFIIHRGELYQGSHMGKNLLCLDRRRAEKVMEEIHVGVCRPHMNGHMLAKKIAR